MFSAGRKCQCGCNKFKNARMALNDDQRNTEADSDENCVIFESLIREDRRFNAHEIGEEKGIAKSAVHEII
jgi:hypothetical protein